MSLKGDERHVLCVGVIVRPKELISKINDIQGHNDATSEVTTSYGLFSYAI